MRPFCREKGLIGTVLRIQFSSTDASLPCYLCTYINSFTSLSLSLCSYMSVLLPTLDWSEPSSFSILIVRINKLFKKLRDDPNVSMPAYRIVIWDTEIHESSKAAKEPIRPGKLCFASVLAYFEPCHLNCHYCLPSNDMPTLNGHSHSRFAKTNLVYLVLIAKVSLISSW